MSASKGMQGRCYDCIWRGEVPGSCHSSCEHPVTQAPAAIIKELFNSGGADSTMHRQLKIDYNPQGFEGGWFFWPFNFDPVWLRNCVGFELGPASGRGQ